MSSLSCYLWSQTSSSCLVWEVSSFSIFCWLHREFCWLYHVLLCITMRHFSTSALRWWHDHYWEWYCLFEAASLEAVWDKRSWFSMSFPAHCACLLSLGLSTLTIEVFFRHSWAWYFLRSFSFWFSICIYSNKAEFEASQWWWRFFTTTHKVQGTWWCSYLSCRYSTRYFSCGTCSVSVC